MKVANELTGLEAELLSIHEVAALCGVSWRSVYRLSDGGRMPAPLRIGGSGKLIRWRRAELEEWIANGCPAVER